MHSITMITRLHIAATAATPTSQCRKRRAKRFELCCSTKIICATNASRSREWQNTSIRCCWSVLLVFQLLCPTISTARPTATITGKPVQQTPRPACWCSTTRAKSPSSVIPPELYAQSKPVLLENGMGSTPDVREYSCSNLTEVQKSIRYSGPLEYYLHYLMYRFSVPISIEKMPEFRHLSDDRFVSIWREQYDVDVDIGQGSLTEALAEIPRQSNDQYTWMSWDCRMINVLPSYLVNSTDYYMNQKICPPAPFRGDYNSAGSKIARELRMAGWPVEIRIFGSLLRSTRGCCSSDAEKTSVFALTDRNLNFGEREKSVRQMMNELTAQLSGRMSWTAESWYSISRGSQSSHRPSFRLYSRILPDLVPSCGECVRTSRLSYSCGVNVRDGLLASKREDGSSAKSNAATCEFLSRVRDFNIIRVPVDRAVNEMSRSYGVPIHFESHEQRCVDGADRCENTITVSIDGRMTLKQALERMTGQTGVYTYGCWRGRSINVYPFLDSRSQLYLMNHELQGLGSIGDILGGALLASRGTADELISHIASAFSWQVEVAGFGSCLENIGSEALLKLLEDLRSETVSFRGFLNRLVDTSDGCRWVLDRRIVRPPKNAVDTAEENLLFDGFEYRVMLSTSVYE